MSGLKIGRNPITKETVTLGAGWPRVMFICGKRGSGKSYTAGVLVEELFEMPVAKVIVVVDPMGIYHTFAQENKEQQSNLAEWDMFPKKYPVRLFVPCDPGLKLGDEVVVRMQDRGIDVKRLRIAPADLSPELWCSLFGLSINDVTGVALFRAVSDLQETNEDYNIGDIKHNLAMDIHSHGKVREVLMSRLDAASKWGIFSNSRLHAQDNFDMNAINVLDLSVLDPGTHGLRSMIMDVITRKLFIEWTRIRKRYEFGLAHCTPMLWLVIDEAHQFVPQKGDSLCKQSLIRWVKEGRQMNLGMIAITQQPAAMDSDLLSQNDVVLAHKITSIEDVEALDRLSATYMTDDLKSLVSDLDQKGEAILVDDESESVSRVIIRPRCSRHGGGHPETETLELLRAKKAILQQGYKYKKGWLA